MMSDTYITIKAIQDRVVDVCYYSGTLLEILICTLLTTKFLNPRTSSLKGGFFYILFIGYFLDICYELGFTCQRYLTKDWSANNIIDIPFFKYFESIIQWYYMLYMGPACVFLSINRFTSICFITKHQRLWAKWFPVVLVVLLSYPCIVGGYSFSDIHCRMDVYSPECSAYMQTDFLVSAISNVVASIISLIIGIISSLMYRIKFSRTKQYQTNQIKIEHKLLIHSVWSNVMFGFWACLTIFDPYFYEVKDDSAIFVIYQVYQLIADAAYVSYHYGSICLLFFFSAAMRTEFIKFYHLRWLFRLCRKRSNSITVLNSVIPTNHSSTFGHRKVSMVDINLRRLS